MATPRHRTQRRKTRRAKKAAVRPRNPVALPTRRLGLKVKPSAKLYRRRAKHPESEEG